MGWYGNSNSNLTKLIVKLDCVGWGWSIKHLTFGRSNLERVSLWGWTWRIRAKMFALWKRSLAAAHSITTGCRHTGWRCKHRYFTYPIYLSRWHEGGSAWRVVRRTLSALWWEYFWQCLQYLWLQKLKKSLSSNVSKYWSFTPYRISRIST